MSKDKFLFIGLVLIGFCLITTLVYADTTGWVWVEDTSYSVAQTAVPTGGKVGLNSTGTINQDWGVFTDIYISRDNGSNWIPIVENDSKTIRWGYPTTLASVNVPVGTYTWSKNRQSDEWLICTLYIDHDGDNDAGDLVTVPNVHVDLGGDAGSFCQDSISLEISRNQSASLSMNNPIVACWVQVNFNEARRML